MTQSMRLPDSWVKSLFAKFGAIYGSQFAAKWDGQDQAALISTWAEALGPYIDDGDNRGERIKWALAFARDNNPFPPNLAEFVQIVRQAPRPEPIALPAPVVPKDVAAARLKQISSVAKKIADQRDHHAWAKEPPAIPAGSAWERALCGLAKTDDVFMGHLRSHATKGVKLSSSARSLASGEAE